MSDREERSDRLRKRFADDPDADESDSGVQPSHSAETANHSQTDSKSQPAQTATTDKTDKADNSSKEDKPSKTDKSSKTDVPSEMAQPDTARTESVKDRPSVLMYLPDELRRELDIRFDELNAKHKREYDVGLEKNKDYYPMIVELAFEKMDELDDAEVLSRLT